MTAFTPALHLLVALSMTAPPIDPSKCAADDLQCSAPAFAARARRARSNLERVQYLYFAHRAYLGLADRPPEGHVSASDLCHAHRLIEQALALPATSLRPRVVNSGRDTLARLAEKKVRCKRPEHGRRGEPQPVMLAIGGSGVDAAEQAQPPAPTPGKADAAPPAEVADPPAATASPSASPAHADSPSAPPSPYTSSVASASPGDGVADASRVRATWRPPRSEVFRTGSPPGRRLLIGGGVSLVAGIAWMGIAAYTGARALDARRTGHERMTLAATSENLMRNERLEHDYRRLGTAAVVTGVVAGAAVVAAVVMLCVGARRKARAADSEPMLMPVRTGLLFTLQF